LTLHQEGFPLGDWAARLLEDVKNKVHGGVSSSEVKEEAEWRMM